ncbi:MAG: helix-turn-helix domain-containing protein [Rhizobiaceae bacterium]|nr:helix-turn-helix domain-containing protein [Rhizobiaceae bacterium]
MTANVITIGYLARETGTKVETVRFYEKAGLLPPPARTDGNYRSYDLAHVERLSFIRRSRDLGFSLDQIRTMLTLSDDKDQPCASVDAIAKEHREEVVRKIADLASLKAELDRMIDRCGSGVVADCRIIESLSPRPLHRS